MKNNKIVVLILTAVFLLLTITVTFLFKDDIVNKEIPITFLLSTEEENRQISVFSSKDKKCYVFLPSFADLEDLTVKLKTDSKVYINGKEVLSGSSFSNLKFDTEYDFKYKGNNQKIVFLKSKNIPALYIDSNSGNMDYIHAKKGNEEKGKINLYNCDGTVNYSGEIESIKGRGNNTWDGYDKKPYSITLSKSADLLGMGSDEEWILLANATDNSNIRNKLAYDFAGMAGLEYSPQSDWVDLYLNGEYVGLYLLCERNEVGSKRVNISLNDFLVSLEPKERLTKQNIIFALTKTDMAFRVHYPKNATAQQLNKVTEILQSVENAALSPDSTDSETQKKLEELIDIDSWARKYLVDEILGNLDGGYASHFLYTDSQKVYAGPVWDYDRSMGNGEGIFYNITNPNVFVVNRYIKGKDNINNPVLAAVCSKDFFKEYTHKIFKDEFVSLTETVLEEKIPEYTERIEKSATMNALRWLDNADGFSLKTEAETVSNYIDNHTDFLSENWLLGKEYCQIGFLNLDSDLFFTVQKGGEISQLPNIEDTENAKFLGFYYVDCDEKFDITRPINSNIEVYAKWDYNLNKTENRIIKYSPIAIIAVFFIVIFIIDIKRNKWKR